MELSWWARFIPDTSQGSLKYPWSSRSTEGSVPSTPLTESVGLAFVVRQNFQILRSRARPHMDRSLCSAQESLCSVGTPQNVTQACAGFYRGTLSCTLKYAEQSDFGLLGMAWYFCLKKKSIKIKNIKGWNEQSTNIYKICIWRCGHKTQVFLCYTMWFLCTLYILLTWSMM